MVTASPAMPLGGSKPMILGSTLNTPVLCPLPARFVRLRRPLVAPAATVARNDVFDTTVSALAGVPLKVASVTPVRLTPLTVTIVPTGPDAGVRDVIPGARITRSDVALVTVPSAVVTVMGPVTAVGGTANVNSVALALVAVTATVPTLAIALALTPRRLKPLTVTLSPAMTLAGEKPVIFGSTLNRPVLCALAARFVTPRRPVVAPAGTVARSDVFESTVSSVAGVPSKVTSVTPSKLVPLRATTVPTAPDAGANELSAGGRITTRSVALVAVPSGVRMVIRPVAAVAGICSVTDVGLAVITAAATVPTCTMGLALPLSRFD